MSSNNTINRFQQHYENVLVHDLASKLSISNSLEIPSIKKIIISSSVNFVPKQTRGMIQESYSIKRSTKKGSRAGESAFSSKAGSRNNEKKHTEGTRSAGTAEKDEPNFFLIFIIAIFNLYSRCNRSGNSFLKSLTTKFSRSSFSRYGWNY